MDTYVEYEYSLRCSIVYIGSLLFGGIIMYAINEMNSKNLASRLTGRRSSAY
jgi:hypothetical protein